MPVLAPLLADERLAEAARYALEGIAVPEAASALCERGDASVMMVVLEQAHSKDASVRADGSGARPV